MARRPVGIEVRHKKSCRSHDARPCNCRPSYRAWVWDPRSRRRLRSRCFSTLASAKTWREDAVVGLRRGTLAARSRTTVSDAAADFLDGIRSGRILTRTGEPYRPASVRGYERGLRLYVVPTLGTTLLSDLRRRDVQLLVDELVGDGLAGSTVRNALDPLRRICGRALQRELIAVNPTVGLDVPAARSKQKRIASPEEARRLLAAVPDGDRPLWATAFWAGLRRGELRALRWADVDFGARWISVERSWDDIDGESPQGKTPAARRRVPLIEDLKALLAAHKLATGRRDQQLVFGAEPNRPFEPTTTRRRALAHWDGAGLQPIQLHECRHTFASLLVAADVNVKAISTYMGHASVKITLDLYGHLLPNAERESARRLQAFLDQSVAAATP